MGFPPNTARTATNEFLYKETDTREICVVKNNLNRTIVAPVHLKSDQRCQSKFTLTPLDVTPT